MNTVASRRSGETATSLAEPVPSPPDWSAAKAAKLRRVLKGDAAYALKLAHKSDASLGVALPVLAATMYLAEPRRNPRAFPINLMLLDLIEDKTQYGSGKSYTWDKVLWHPDAKKFGEPGGKSTPSKPQKGSLGTGGGIGTIRHKDELHQTGGKLPAAGTGSGYGDIRDDINPDKYYTQAKEVTILARWLSCQNWNLKPGKNEADLTGATEIAYQGGIKPNLKADPRAAKDPAGQQKQVLAQIKGLIASRCATFDFKAVDVMSISGWGEPVQITATDLDYLLTI